MSQIPAQPPTVYFTVKLYELKLLSEPLTSMKTGKVSDANTIKLDQHAIHICYRAALCRKLVAQGKRNRQAPQKEATTL